MKKLLSIILAASLMLSMAACSSSKPSAPDANTQTASSGEQESAEKLHFVYVSPLLAHPVWLIAKDGFDQACSELGIQGDWVGPQGISPEEMTKLVETAIAQKADAIITQGLVPAVPVQKAVEASIPVLVVDSDLPDVDRLAFFGKDVSKQAEVLYQDAVSKLGENTPIKCSIQVAALNYQIAHDQIAAIEAVFSKHPGGFEVVNTTESKSDKMKATTEWQNTFKTYPEINLAINLAAEAGPACANVIEEMGIRDNVTVYGVDDVEETLDLIRSGKLDGTVVTSFFNYGYQAAYWLYQNVTEGKKPETVINDAGTIIVNNENIDSYADALKVKVDLK